MRGARPARWSACRRGRCRPARGDRAPSRPVNEPARGDGSAAHHVARVIVDATEALLTQGVIRGYDTVSVVVSDDVELGGTHCARAFFRAARFDRRTPSLPRPRCGGHGGGCSSGVGSRAATGGGSHDQHDSYSRVVFSCPRNGGGRAARGEQAKPLSKCAKMTESEGGQVHVAQSESGGAIEEQELRTGGAGGPRHPSVTRTFSATAARPGSRRSAGTRPSGSSATPQPPRST